MRHLLFLVILFVLSGSYALAGAMEGQPTCDADFNKRMTSRAWMEAEREIEMAEILIKKPRSVLEYSCFLSQAIDLGGAANMGEDAAQVFEQGSLQGSVDYLKQSFPGSTTCAAMSEVWKEAQCQNFSENYFIDFPVMYAVDMRMCNNPKRNEDWKKAVLLSVEQGEIDPQQNWLDQTSAKRCVTIKPQPTGVTYEVDGKPLEDKVCLAAGCTYDGENSCQ